MKEDYEFNSEFEPDPDHTYLIDYPELIGFWWGLIFSLFIFASIILAISPP